MGTVINRTTKEIRRSVNTPEFAIEEWLQNPDESPVDGLPEKYWQIDGDSLRPMTTEERAVVDALELVQAKTQRITEVQRQAVEMLERLYPTFSQVFFLQLWIRAIEDQRPNQAAYVRQVADYGSAILWAASQVHAAIYQAESIDAVNAITLDTAALEQLDPLCTVAAASAIQD